MYNLSRVFFTLNETYHVHLRLQISNRKPRFWILTSFFFLGLKVSNFNKHLFEWTRRVRWWWWRWRWWWWWSAGCVRIMTAANWSFNSWAMRTLTAERSFRLFRLYLPYLPVISDLYNELVRSSSEAAVGNNNVLLKSDSFFIISLDRPTHWLAYWLPS